MPLKYNPYSGELDWVMGPGSGTAAIEFDTDSGAANPTGAGVITIAGGTGINTSGTGSAVTINLDDPVIVDNGGTGATTLTGVLTGNGTSPITGNAVTQHGVLIGGASNAVGTTGVGTAGQILTSNGAGMDPTFQAAPGGVTSVSGTTNRISSTGGATPVIDIDAAYVGQASITTLGTVTTGTWNGSTVSEAYGGTNQTTYATGDILYASGANTLAKLPAGSDTEVLTLASGVPSWAAPTVGTVTSVSGTTNRISSTGGATPVIDIDAAYVGQASITTLGTVTTGTWNADTVTVDYGGTGRASHTAYAVICGGTTGTGAQQSIASVGTSGQVLTSNGAGALPTFEDHTVPVMTVTSVASGATPYDVLAADQYISCDVSAGILSIRLPNTTTTGRVVVVKDSTGDAATNNLTVTTVGGAVTIDGSTSFVMNTDYEAANFIFNGTSYEVY